MANNIIRILSVLLNNVNIRKKLMISYFIMIIIPLGMFSMIIYGKISDNQKQQILYSALQSLNQAASYLNDRVNQTISVTDGLFYNKAIQEILSRNPAEYDNDTVLQIEDSGMLTSILSSFQQDKNIYRVRLYVRDGLLYSDENVNVFNITNVTNFPWYRKLLSSRERSLWNQPERFSDSDGNTVISLVRKFSNLNNLSETIGILRIDILEDNIKKIISNASISRQGIVYIKNSDGKIISCNDYDKIKSLSSDGNTPDIENKPTPEWENVNMNGKGFFIKMADIRNTDWVLISMIPAEDLTAISKQFGDYILILMLGIVLIAYFFAYLISNSSTKRIGQLVKSMEKLEQGNFEIKNNIIYGKDEIGRLMIKFNFLVRKIADMIQEQFIAGQKIKSAELKALQSQINPHFLYNTLDMINWAAAINQVPEIESTVQNLAKFYKLSLSKGKETIPIADEIEHIKVYLEIQNQRLENRIKLDLNIDEEIYEYSTIKIILQPIVENAILHGIMEKENNTGEIRISGKLDNSDIIISIHDDGIGMSEEKLQTLLTKEISSQNYGYGIKNINERIKLYYGSQYGLTYKSAVGEGTSVEVRIPAVRKSEDS
ncbi:MAG: sensor histidine kinase [Ruminiclostridium sp.]|nr:sensor histidine kinase [Ruminiclostridium sp.]